MKRNFQLLLLFFCATFLCGCHKAPNLKAIGPFYQNSTQNSRSQGFAQAANINFSANSDDPISSEKINNLLAEAQINLRNKQASKALALLKTVEYNANQLNHMTRLSLYQTLTQAYFAKHEILPAINSSTLSASLLYSDQDRERYLSHIWQKLQALSKSQLETLYEKADNAVQRGWLALTLISNNSPNAETLIKNIKQWQASYNNHPAFALLSNVFESQAALLQLPKRITLLLPITGVLAKQGKAIRNGFLAAYYQNKSQGFAPEVEVLDTNQNNINLLYQKAIQSGTNLVIGPLLKANIEQLISSQPLYVPVIALNSIPSNQNIVNLYQFGLSPEDESSQIAQKMISNRHQRILLITPNNEWGNRIQAAFEKTWNKLGGQIISRLAYSSQKKLAHELRTLLNLDQSLKRERNLRWLLKEKIRFIPRRRQDFDAIFLAANPAIGRQIIPLLRFYYANNVPIYSISNIYQKSLTEHKNHDLDGIIFDDIPWLFIDNAQLPNKISAIRENAAKAWPNSFKQYSRFYALGADAFDLIANLNKLTLLPHFGLKGATGILYLQPNRQIYREPTFAKMINGKPTLISL